MEINDPKHAAVIASAVHVYIALGPLMGTQQLNDEQADELQAILNELHTTATNVVHDAVRPLMERDPETMTPNEESEIDEWSWMLSVFTHIERHADRARAVFEQRFKANIARFN